MRRIDIEALRRARAPRPTPRPANLIGLLDDADGAGWSRRDFLAVTGTTAAVLLPGPPALPLAPLESLTVTRQGTAAVFTIGRRAIWTIDAALFAGSPRLTVRGKRVTGAAPATVELQGARYPGTALALTLRATVSRRDDGYRLRLEVAQGASHVGMANWTAEVDLLHWLEGRAATTATLSPRHTRQLLGAHLVPGLALTAPHGLRVTIEPALTLSLCGACALTGLPGATLQTEQVTLRPLAATAPSLFIAPPRARSLLTLQRGTQTWPASIEQEHRDGWALRGEGHDLFDEVRVEAADGGYVAHFVPADQPRGSLLFHPAAALGGLRLERPSLVLSRGVGAGSVGGARGREEEWAVVGDFAPRAGWIVQGGCAVELGVEETTEPFVLAATRGLTRTLTCVPAIKSVVVPLAGTVSRPTRLAGRDAHLAFHHARGAVRSASGRHGATSTATVHGRDRLRLRLGAADAPLRVDVIRPQDMLMVPFEFVNMSLDPSGAAPRVVRLDRTAAAYLLVHFPPQHMAETAWPYTPTQPFSQTALANESRLAFRVSDTVTEIPYTLAALLDWSRPRLTLEVAPTARLAPTQLLGPAIGKPAPTETALELPYRLVLSPSEAGAWVHPTDPVALAPTGTGGTRTDLWHTRLATPTDDPHVDARDATVRAIWTPFYNVDSTGGQTIYTPFNSGPPHVPDARAAITEEELRQIVALSATRSRTFDPYAFQPYIAGIYTVEDSPPITVNRLMLSALGGWLDVHGQWDYSASLYQFAPWPTGVGRDVAEWRHVATMGRDQYVRIVKGGRLFPFGHRAAMVEITERDFGAPTSEFSDPPDGTGVVGYLRKRTYIVVQQPTVAFDTRGLHYTSVTIKTEVTPDIAPGRVDPNDTNPDFAKNAFWPLDTTQGSSHVRFQMEGVDAVGQTSHWTMPLIFVLDNPPDQNTLGKVRTYYNGLGATDTLRKCDMQGQLIAYAPLPPNGDHGSTTLPTNALSFGFPDASGGGGAGRGGASAATPRWRIPGAGALSAGLAGLHQPSLAQPAGLPRLSRAQRTRLRQARTRRSALDAAGFAPELHQAEVQVQALAALANGQSTYTATLADAYKSSGFDTAVNKGQMFLQFVHNPASAAAHFAADQSGGLATPNLSPIGLSAMIGPVGGNVKVDPAEQIKNLAQGQFDPTTFFKDAKLLGGINLADILPDPKVPQSDLPDLGSGAPRIKAQVYFKNPDGTETTTLSVPTPTPSNPVPALPKPVRVETSIQWMPPRLTPVAVPGDKATRPLFIPYPNSLVDDDGKPFTNPFTGAQPSTLTIDGKIITDLTGGNNSSYVMHGKLTNFSLRLIPLLMPLLEVQFSQLSFDAQTGQKPAVTPKIHDVLFLGPLSFLDALKSFIGSPTPGGGGGGGGDGGAFAQPIIDLQPLAGGDGSRFGRAPARVARARGRGPVQRHWERRQPAGLTLQRARVRGQARPLLYLVRQPAAAPRRSLVNRTVPAWPLYRTSAPAGGVFASGPSLDIRPDGLTVGYTLAIPDLGFGVFTLEHIKLSAALDLPFIDGSIVFRFAFSTRQDPFNLSIYGIGGGGFFGLTVSPDSTLNVVEASLEVGANVALDLVVASAAVHVFLGIYYRQTSADVHIEAYFRAGGLADILGLVTVSVEFYLGLAYNFVSRILSGTASLTVEVDVACFSKSVTLTVHKEFNASGIAPNLAAGDGQLADRTWGLTGADQGRLLATPDATGLSRLPRAAGDTLHTPFSAAMGPGRWELYVDAFA